MIRRATTLSPLLYPSHKAQMANLYPQTRGQSGTGIFLTDKRMPFGCGVYFKPAVAKYHVDKANARAQFGVFFGHRLARSCRWNGECLVADLSDVVNLDLAEDASTSRRLSTSQRGVNIPHEEKI